MSLTYSPLHASEHVVLLHGLARTPSSMQKMEAALTDRAYIVHNLSYDSRHQTIEASAAIIAQQIKEISADASRVHIVTHSLGGILARQIHTTDPIPNLGRVVMLSPPNAGSEVVDKIGHWWIFKKLNGPAGQQLSTSPESLPNSLGEIDFECGVLTGDRSVNWINSLMIQGKDDGKVSTTSAQIQGMADYKVVHTTHPFIMKNQSVINFTMKFLETGTFDE